MQRGSKIILTPMLFVLALGIAGGCSDSRIADTPIQQTTLELEPANIVLDPGKTATVAAYVIENGSRVLAKSPRYSVEWLVSDPTVASVTANGAIATVAGIRGGAAQVEAIVHENTSAATLRRAANVTTRPSVVSLRIAAGNYQVAAVMTTLPQQLTVQALNRDNFGVAGVPIRFTLRNGSGVIGEQDVLTDEAGFARSTFTFGAEAGLATIEALADGVAPVTFDAIGIAAPAALEEFQGNDQQALEHSVLPVPLGVRVVDATHTPLPGVTVEWSVTGGGGQITATSISDNAGVATAFWTVGTEGVQTAKAITGDKDATFNARAVKNGQSKLIKVSGDGQSATVRTALKNPLVVRVTDSDGNPRAGVAVGFSVTSGGGSVSPAQAATDASGFARTTWTLGSAAGLGSVRAAANGIGSLSFTSTATSEGTAPPSTPVVTSLVLSPQSVSLTALGAQSSLTAATYDAGNQVVTGQTINFTSSNPMVVTVDNVGRLTAKGVGTALIVASALCCEKADTTAVTVTQQLASIVVSPHSASVAVGLTTQATASAKDANGNTIPSTPITWSTSNSAIATVSGGTIRGVAGGAAYVKAVSGTYRDSVAVTVSGGTTTPTPVLTSITLTPNNPSLLVGSTQAFTAVAKDQNGNAMTGVSFTWSSSNPSVMSVSNGVVTALAVGLAALNVTSNGVNGSTQVTISSTAPSPPSSGPFSPPDIAFADMEDGTTGDFTNASGGTTGSPDITILKDPTGQFGGNVAEVHYLRASTSTSPDINRALRHLLANPIGFGETVFVRGHVYIPSPAANMLTEMRKLIYFQRQPNDASFAVIKAVGNSLKAEITNFRVFDGGTFPFDKKVSIEVQITANTGAGVTDGVFRLWKDGVLVIDRTNIEWLKDSSPFKVVMFGQQTQSDQLFDEVRYWDNLAISTKRIGQ